MHKSLGCSRAQLAPGFFGSACMAIPGPNVTYSGSEPDSQMLAPYLGSEPDSDARTLLGLRTQLTDARTSSLTFPRLSGCRSCRSSGKSPALQGCHDNQKHMCQCCGTALGTENIYRSWPLLFAEELCLYITEKSVSGSLTPCCPRLCPMAQGNNSYFPEAALRG